MLRIFFFLILIPFLLGFDFFKGESFKKAHIGIVVFDLKNGKEIYTYNAEKNFTPASLQKIITSVAAIHFLGENFRFTTDLFYYGDIDKTGLLHGDVWLCGGGDPTLSLDILSIWEKKLKQKGIKKISGKIFVDISCFESSLASPFWEFTDIGNYYGAGACGLTINKNSYTISFKGGKKENDRAKVIKMEPEIPGLIWHNEVITGPKDSGDQVNIFGMEYSPRQFYRGSVPLNANNFKVKAAIFDPAFFCGHYLNSKIPALSGVEVVKEKIQQQKGKLLFRHLSPPLKQILKEMNFYSINLYAEHLIKAIGNGKAKIGIQKTEEFLQNNFNISLHVKDGSGLARTNYISPKNLVKLLCRIRKDPKYAAVYDSFPHVGEGSLKKFPKLSAELKGKTGCMEGVQNLAGYIIYPDRREYVFCIICNNYEGNTKGIKNEIFNFLKYLSLQNSSHPIL